MNNEFVFKKNLEKKKDGSTLVKYGYTLVKYRGDSSDVIVPDTFAGEDVTVIGEHAFWDCYTPLKSIKLPKNLTEIQDSAFFSHEELKEMKLPKKLTKIGDGVFMDWKDLTEIDIPDRVTSIGIRAFNGCSSLKSIKLPKKLTEIGYEAFSDCVKLEKVDFQGGLPKNFDEDIFKNTPYEAMFNLLFN